MTRLEALGLPSLTSRVLASFASQGIVSAEDFLLSAHTSRLEATGNQAQKQAIADILQYLERQSWGFRTGSIMLRGMQTLGTQYLPTGCESVDKLLDGGLLEGTVTELVGASSTGKTQLCMQVAASVAYHYRAMVAYVDTCHSFSSTRVAHMLAVIAGTKEGAQRAGAADEIGEAMKGIIHNNVFNVFSMLSLLNELHNSITTQSQILTQSNEQLKKMRLLIVDSASAVISPILGGNQAQGHALMVSMGIALKKLALENHLAVLITNHTVGGEGGQPKPALGESWKAVPHVRLLLAREPSSNVCQVSVIKHTSMECRQTCFRISKAGLK